MDSKKCKHFKHLSLILIILQLLPLLMLNGCISVQEQLANRDDAIIAYKQNDTFIETFSFSDLYALQTILKETYRKYRLGLVHLKRETKNMVDSERIPREKKLAKVESRLNLLDAYIDNLMIYYPEDWNDNKENLATLVKEIQSIFHESYDSIFDKK